MLSPDARSLYTAALTPPLGFVFDQALATTFSVDPTTLLTVPLHLALLNRGTDVERDGIALLEALRRVAERTTVFTQRGRMQVPSESHTLYALLESMLVEARAPAGGAFHPKLWVLRFVDPESEVPRLRLLVLSRNLTEDRSWDLLLQLEGTPGPGAVEANAELADLLRDLPDMAVEAVPVPRRAQVQRLAEEVRCTRWDLPPGFDSVRFHVLGRGRTVWMLPRSKELAVLSPFLTAEALAALRKSTDKLVAVISRPEELEKLSASTRSLAERCWVLEDAAETEDGEASERHDTLGLHAKALILACGAETKLFVGSANATSAALLAGLNVELMAELTGKRAKVQGIHELLGPDGLGSVLSEYLPPAEPSPVDVEREAAEAALEKAREELARCPLLVRCEPEEGQWRLVLEPKGPVKAEGVARLRVWPLTVQEDRAVDALTLLGGASIVLGRFALASITGMVAFELVAQASSQVWLRFALNLQIEGLPADRDAAILRTVVNNRESFLRYLLLLLGDLAGEQLLEAHSGVGQAPGNGLRHGAEGELPLLEDLTRAFSREPARLREVRRVIERLQASPEVQEVVPPEFLALWRVFEDALAAPGPAEKP